MNQYAVSKFHTRIVCFSHLTMLMTRASQFALMQLFRCFPALLPSFSPGGGHRMLPGCDSGAPHLCGLEKNHPSEGRSVIITHFWELVKGFGTNFGKSLEACENSPSFLSLPIFPRVGLPICIFRTDAKENITYPSAGCQGFFGKAQEMAISLRKRAWQKAITSAVCRAAAPG